MTRGGRDGDQAVRQGASGADGAGRALFVVLSATAAGAAWYVWQDLQVDYVEVRFVVPAAPQLTADSETQQRRTASTPPAPR